MDSSNYRGIALSSIYGKLFDLVILSRFIYLFEIQQTYLHTNEKTKYSEHKIVGLKINKHAAWHYRVLNLIKSRLLYATRYRH